MYRWVDHTGEVELAVAAETEEGVFEEATRAMGELLGEAQAEGRIESRPVEAEGRDLPALLAGWLDELIYLADTAGFVPARALEVELGDARAAGTVEGRTGGASALVKAVTYHRLAFRRAAGGWEATVVLDV